MLALTRVVPLISLDPGGARAAEPPSASATNIEQTASPNVAEAERLAALAFDAYGRKHYERALSLYASALTAARSADILYNIARVYDVGLHDGVHASEYYRLYLAEPKALPARSEFAGRRIAELQAAAPELRPAAHGATAASGASPGVPEPEDEGASPRALLAAPAAAWTWRETTAAALAGSGVIALGVGIGFGVSAYAKSDEWRSECAGNVCRSQRGVDAARTAARRARVATLALAAGGGLVAGGAAVWWFGSKQDERASHVALQVAPAGSGADVRCALSGSF